MNVVMGPALAGDIHLLAPPWSLGDAGEGLAWCVLLGAIPGKETATLGAALPKGYPARSSRVPHNCGQKLRVGGEALVFTFKVPNVVGGT